MIRAGRTDLALSRRAFGLGLAGLLVPGASPAQQANQGRARAGAAHGGGIPAGAAVDLYVGRLMREIGIPGAALAVTRNGQTALLRHYGTASLEFGIPVADDTVFAINSITKAFTGVAAMRLVEAGRLDLSESVGTYLGDLPEAWRGVAIRQLLSHMSGLPDVVRAPTVETDAAQAWAWVEAQPILFRPGDRFHYCQTNYTLIQRVLNRIEGRSAEATLAGEQLAIAGMASTSYGDSTDLIARKAPTYRWSTGQGSGAARQLRVAAERFLPFRRASSGLNSSAADMARWMIAVEGGTLLGRESLETMWRPVSFSNGIAGQWGLGWQILQRGRGRAVGMTGGGRAAFYLYPEHRLGVAILTNLAGAFPEDMIDRVASIVEPAIELTGVPALRLALDEQGYRHAPEAARALEAADPALRWSETELNDWGYRLLSTGRLQPALAILALTADRFPASGNAQDSLAEAYLANGEPARAIEHYRRSLELDPANSNARAQLQRLSEPPPPGGR